VRKGEGLQIQFGKFSTLVEAYVLELEDIDMVLGVTWLQRFGKVNFDWKEKEISLYWEGKRVKLQGHLFSDKKIIREKQLNMAIVVTLQSGKVTRWEGNREIITWELGILKKNHGLNASLEDKANFEGGGIDRTLSSCTCVGPIVGPNPHKHNL